MWIGIICLFLTLGYFKYTLFFLDIISSLAGLAGVGLKVPQIDIILPVGISFFVFQACGYLVDVYRGDCKAERNFLKYALFVSFFPQLVAGPIERSTHLLEQLAVTHKFDFEKFQKGILVMLWGYFLKIVVADRAALFVDSIYNDSSFSHGGAILIATILFSFQIYGDFAGYSYIALGAAKILGIDLIDNFASPYLSTTVKEFWNRWHISLNTWFRDYVYIPLGGNRSGKIKKYRNIMITFLLSGLWHGAGWNFVVWGGLNGLYQVVSDLIMPFRKKVFTKKNIDKTVVFRFISGIVTFFAVTLAWLFFRADGINDGITKLSHIFSDFDADLLFSSDIYKHGLNKANFWLLIICILFVLIIDYIRKKDICISNVMLEKNACLRMVTIWIGIVFILIFGIWGNQYDAQSFIYFQF